MNLLRLLLIFGLIGCWATPTSGRTILIHPVGDSITRGMDRDAYRLKLSEILRARNINFHFVGSLDDGSKAHPERAHDGHDGWVTEQIEAHVGAWLEEFKPDVILLMIGANDLETGADVDTVIARYRSLLDRIYKVAPRVHVLAAEVSVIRDRHFDRLAQAFNKRLREMVTLETARAITFVPMHDAFDEGDLRDLDHPTTRGNTRMAQRWSEYLLPVVTEMTKGPIHP